MNKKVLFAVPERLLSQIDCLADLRSQTRSELIREALRIHLERFRAAGVPEVSPQLALISGSARNDDPGLSAAVN